MSHEKLVSLHQGKKFEIEEDNPDVGFYLYIFEDDKCIADHLQDSLEAAKEVAWERYAVPKSSWHPPLSGNFP